MIFIRRGVLPTNKQGWKMRLKRELIRTASIVFAVTLAIVPGPSQAMAGTMVLSGDLTHGAYGGITLSIPGFEVVAGTTELDIRFHDGKSVRVTAPGQIAGDGWDGFEAYVERLVSRGLELVV